MVLEEKIPRRNLRGISKDLDIYGFGIVNYYVSSESGCMVTLGAQAY